MNQIVKRRMKNRSINFGTPNSLRLEINIRKLKKKLRKEKVSEKLSSE